MEIKGFVSASYPIIHSSAGRHHGPIAEVVGHRTKGAYIRKEFGEVAHVSDVNIVADGMRIIEMKAVVKMI